MRSATSAHGWTSRWRGTGHGWKGPGSRTTRAGWRRWCRLARRSRTRAYTPSVRFCSPRPSARKDQAICAACDICSTGRFARMHLSPSTAPASSASSTARSAHAATASRTRALGGIPGRRSASRTRRMPLAVQSIRSRVFPRTADRVPRIPSFASGVGPVSTRSRRRPGSKSISAAKIRGRSSVSMTR